MKDYQKTIHFLSGIVVLISLTRCYHANISDGQERETIVYPDSLLFIWKTDSIKKPFSLISIINADCSCSIKEIKDWLALVQKYPILSQKANRIYIAETKNELTFMSWVEREQPCCNIYIDHAEYFTRLNKSNERKHFLLMGDTILIVSSSIMDKKILTKYINILENDSLYDENTFLSRGIVVDKYTGKPLPNTQIYINKDTIAINSNEHGEFNIKARKSEILQFHKGGYVWQSFKIESQEIRKIELTPSMSSDWMIIQKEMEDSITIIYDDKKTIKEEWNDIPHAQSVRMFRRSNGQRIFVIKSKSE